LIRRVTAPQGKETDVSIVEVYLGTNEAMGPVRSDEEQMTEKRGKAMVVGATKEDDHSGRTCLQIKLSEQGKRKARGAALGTRCVANSIRSEPSIRALLKVVEGRMLEASPDLGLPATVETLDGILKARLTGRSEDRGNAKQQTDAHDTTDDVAVLMWPLENRCIVELCVARKTERPPSSGEQLDNVGSRDRLTWPA
jgi:hypothetical protein